MTSRSPTTSPSTSAVRAERSESLARSSQAKLTYFEVTVLGATGLPKTSLASEFRVKIRVDGVIRAISKVARSHSPRWDEKFSCISSGTAPLILELYAKHRFRFRTERLVGLVSLDLATVQSGILTTFKENIVHETDLTRPLGWLEFSVNVKTPDITQEISDAVEGVYNVVDAVVAVLQPDQDILSPLLEKLKMFADMVTESPEVYSYAVSSWKIISLAHKVNDRQRRIEDDVRGLLASMKTFYTRIERLVRFSNRAALEKSENALLRVAKQTVECSYFIQDCCLHHFPSRRDRTIAESVKEKIDEYKRVFENMGQKFESESLEDARIVTFVILDEVQDHHAHLHLGQLPLAASASLIETTDSSELCLPGTRTGILSQMIDWANAIFPDSQFQRILLLTGPAGSGKSAIARTIASHFHGLGRLGASFAFSRPNKSLRIDQLIPHIAHQLARLGSAVQNALAEVISRDQEVLSVTDLRRQFKLLLVEVLRGLTISGPIVIIIDAIDEASDGTYAETQQLEELVTVFADLASALPPQIRVIITSRPIHVVLASVAGCPAVVRMDMSSISPQSADTDLHLYVKQQLSLPAISDQDRDRIASMSEGQFLWAYITCKEILDPQGPPPEIQCERVINRGNRGLDELYGGILERNFDVGETPHLLSVMSFIFALREPVQKPTLNSLWKAAGNDSAVLQNVLNHTRPLLDGIDDTSKVIVPSHLSLRDFLMDPARSKEFYIGPTSTQIAEKGLVLACMRIMQTQLSFNMCKLESSYLLNKDILNLLARVKESIRLECLYACCYWAEHLKRVDEVEKFFAVAAVQVAMKLFVEDKLLFWLETLSVLGKVSIALPSMSVLTAHLVRYTTVIANAIPLKLAKDAQQFVQVCVPVASLSAPHIYLSALPFIHPTSAIFMQYSPLFPRLLKVVDTASVFRATSMQSTIHCPETSRVAISPDGEFIAADSLYSIILFNIHTGERVGNSFRGHESWINCLQFSTDGTRLASCSYDATIRLWNVKTGTAAVDPLRGHTSTVQSVAWSSDGQRLVSGSSDNTVRAWDAGSGQEIWCADVGHSIYSVAYSSNGALVASVGSSSDIVLLSGDGRGVGVLCGHTSWIRSVVFSPDDTRLASGSDDSTIRVWDVQERKLVGEPVKHTDNMPVAAVVFSPDGARIASVSEGQTLRLWNLDVTGRLLGQVLGNTSSRSLAFVPDGAFVITASANSITVWDADYIAEDTPAHHTSYVSCVAFSLADQRVVSGSADKTVRIWDSTTGKSIGTPLVGHPSEVTAVAVSPDGTLIVSGSENALYVWNVATSCRVVDPLECHNSTRINAIRFSEDGLRILACSDSEMFIWDAYAGTLCANSDSKLGGERFDLCAFSPDCKFLVCALARDSSHQILVWDVALMKPHSPPWLTTETTSFATVSSDQKIILGHANGHVSIWDMSGKQLQLLPGLHNTRVRAITILPDATYIVSGSDDMTICVWDINTEHIVGHRMHCGDRVFSLAFSTDGNRVVSGWACSNLGRVPSKLAIRSRGTCSFLVQYCPCHAIRVPRNALPAELV